MADNSTAPDTAVRVGRNAQIALVAYNALLVVLVIYFLAKLWPYPTPAFVPPRSDGPAAPTGVIDTLATDSVKPDSVADSATAAAVVDTGTPTTATDSAIPGTIGAGDDAALLPVWLQCDKNLLGMYRNLEKQQVPDFSSIPKCVDLFGGHAIWDEQRLFFMVILAGALGALVHATRSLAMYIGNRSLMRSWLSYYILMPFGGSAVALIFYLVIRGGFFSPGSDFNDTNAFAFTALAALVGLFSQSAILKLKRIAENIFEPPGEERDPLRSDNGESGEDSGEASGNDAQLLATLTSTKPGTMADPAGGKPTGGTNAG